MADKPASSRRDFLRGRAAADAMSAWLDRPDSQLPQPGADRAALLMQIGRRAMATEFQVILNAHQHAAGPEAAMDALDRVEELEAQLSVYREHSEVSLLNRDAPQGEVEVEASLFDLLSMSRQLWSQTGGAFDITAGPLSRAWGFHRRRGQWPAEEALQEALAAVGSNHLQLDEQQRTVRFRRPGLEVNLGAIGKGWALDAAAEAMQLGGVDNFLVHGGRSSVLARGARHAQDGWPVGLMHPLVPQQRLAELTLVDAALGTSGCGNQFFHHQGRRLSHILDPRTGYPAEGVLSATVVAPTAAEADALATACYVLGPEGVPSLLERRPGLAVLLVLPGAKSGAVELLPLGAGLDRWRRVES